MAAYRRFWGVLGSLALIVVLSACSLGTKPTQDPLSVSQSPKNSEKTASSPQWQTYATEAAFGSLKTQ